MNKKNIITITVISVLIVIITLLVFCFNITNIESGIYSVIKNIQTSMCIDIIKKISFIGNVYCLALICAIFVILPKTRKKIGIELSIAFIFSAILNGILKLIFARPRPEFLNIVVEKTYSFPSTHAMLSTTVCITLLLILLEYIKDKKKKIVSIILFSIIPIVISATRIYLGVHYITDVIVGMLLGFLISYIIHIIYFNRKKYDKEKIIT